MKKLLIIGLALSFVISGLLLYDINQKAQEQERRERITAEMTAHVTSTKELLTDTSYIIKVRLRSDAALPAAQEAVETAKEALETSEDKVLDEQSRVALQNTLSASETVMKDIDTPAGIESVPAALAPRIEAVEEAVVAWEEEQERLRKEEEERQRREAERRAAEEAARQEAARQEAARQAATVQQGSSSQGSSNSSGGTRQQGSSNSTPARSNSGGGGGGSSSGGSSGNSGGSSVASRAAGFAAKYGCGSASIVVDHPSLGGSAGKADWVGNAIWVRSGHTGHSFEYVIAHECAHILQYRAYGGGIRDLQADMNSIYGGSGYTGLERNADCITHRWGLRGQHYTSSCGGAKGEAARSILNGRRAATASNPNPTPPAPPGKGWEGCASC